MTNNSNKTSQTPNEGSHAGTSGVANPTSQTSHPEWTYSSLIDALKHRAATQPDKVAYTFLEDGEIESGALTFSQLDLKARAIAARLQQVGSKGDRALLIYMPGLDYIPAFFGCLYAGILAVPVYPPDPTRLKYTVPKLKNIASDAGVSIILTTQLLLEMGQNALAQSNDFPKVTWIGTDSIGTELAASWDEPEIDPEDIAFLQYTSGSTSAPKGVMVTHANLVYNLEDIYNIGRHGSGSIIVSWLPTFHDMGLIFGILSTVYMSLPCFLMSPLAFLQRPFRWLKAIAKYKGTHTAAPNFAYDLCVRKTTPEQRQSLDLSHWVVNSNGAEPVRRESIERFCEAFATSGFKPDAVCTGYGLAEATLKVSACRKEEPPKYKTISGALLDKGRAVDCAQDSPDARTLVGCGRTAMATRITIVDPETRVSKSDCHVGEIWVSGPTVAKGYWNRPEETETTFNAYLANGDGPYLRTGDLGFLDGDELYVTGRIKDLIIIDGQNRYPQDIEWSVQEAHTAVRPGCIAAFSVENLNEERLVVVAEVDRRFTPNRNGNAEPGEIAPSEIEQAIRRAVSEGHDLRTHSIVLIKAGSMPKTSSGKLQRHACRNAWLADTLDKWGV
jgi:acyl-CoA synthetase (AMP-forming)/AMP-acid ligase II